MKAFFEFLALFSLGRMFDIVRQIVKGYWARFYINLVDHARGMFFTLILTLLFLLIFISGFLMIHVALFLYLPWSIAHKALFILILGLVYMVASCVAVGYLQSRNQWLKISGAKAMLDDATSHQGKKD